MKPIFAICTFLCVAVLSATCGFAGVEPSPFSPQAKLLLPAIQDFKTEIAKARGKVNSFDADKGKDLQVLTFTKNSVPAMLEMQGSMKGIIDDNKSPKTRGVVNSLKAKNNALKSILEGQQDNADDPKAATEALNQLNRILKEMEAIINRELAKTPVNQRNAPAAGANRTLNPGSAQGIIIQSDSGPPPSDDKTTVRSIAK